MLIYSTMFILFRAELESSPALRCKEYMVDCTDVALLELPVDYLVNLLLTPQNETVC